MKDYVNQIENHTGQKLKALRTDSGMEYNSENFNSWMKDKGITKETSAPYMQSQNGLAEQTIQMLNNTTSALLQHSGLGKTFWRDVIIYSSFILNSLPKKGETLSPYQKINGS